MKRLIKVIFGATIDNDYITDDIQAVLIDNCTAVVMVDDEPPAFHTVNETSDPSVYYCDLDADTGREVSAEDFLSLVMGC